MARVGPRNVCCPPTWLEISLITSLALLLRSSTSPPTSRAGISINKARPQTTINFSPIERDLILNGKLNESPGTSVIPTSRWDHFVLQSSAAKIFMPARARTHEPLLTTCHLWQLSRHHEPLAPRSRGIQHIVGGPMT